jgi:hypothetical protein
MDCLVTKLKSVVDNDALVKLGELKFRVKNSITDAVVPFAVQGSSAFDAKITGDGYFYKGTISSQTNITTSIIGTTNTGGYRLSPGDYYVSIIPKYGLTSINIRADKHKDYVIQMNIDELQYLESPILLYVSTQDNSLGTHFPISGNLANIREGSVFSLSNTDVVGTMKDMAKFVFENRATSGVPNEVPSKNISGSIEEFVENLISDNYGKTIRLITTYLYPDAPSPITFHGQVYNSTVVDIVVDASGNAVVEKSSTVIGTYNKTSNTWTY